jgi:hypothetical protein
MATKFIRDSANEHLLPRLQENDIYASRWLPIGDRLRRTPRPAAPHIIQLVLREINTDTAAGTPEIDDTRRH